MLSAVSVHALENLPWYTSYNEIFLCGKIFVVFADYLWSVKILPEEI